VVFFIVYAFADTVGFSMLPFIIVGCLSVIAQATVNLMVHHG
jgi:hypothetical protein